MEQAPQGRIGRYVIEGELGKGAMGIVYRAKDPAIGRTVAVKTIRIGQFNDEREVRHVQERMMREAQAAGILSHNNIVTIYDIQHDGDTAFIFMEFVDGDTLEKILLSDTPVDKHVILRLLRQAAEALDYAHERGIIHRDVKPANIMVRKDGVAKIADFGIARMQSHSLTQTGQILGTPNYMSPEQISGRPVDGRADQYSLAVMLYELLTGEKPFVADSLPTLLFRVVSEPPQPAPRFNPTLSPGIDAVLQRALAKSPEERFPTCMEFMRALEAACEASPGWTTIPRGAGAGQATQVAPAPRAQAAPKAVVLPQHQQETIVAAPKPEPAQPPAPKPEPPKPEPPKPEPPKPEPPKPQPPKPEPPKPEPPKPEPPKPAPVKAEAPKPEPPRPQPAPVPTAELAPEPAKKSNLMLICGAALALAIVGGVGIGMFSKSDTPPAEPAPAPTTQESAVPAVTEPPQAQPKSADPAPAKPAAQTPAAPAAPAKPAAPGLLAFAVRTNPEGARIVIDDGKVPPCTSPCVVELPNGRHTATVTLDTYKTENRIFTLPADSALSITLEKRKGFLEVNSTPQGATITIDGAEHSQKTPALIPLTVGKHTVVVSLPGRPPYSQTFEMRPEATISLQPNWGN